MNVNEESMVRNPWIKIISLITITLVLTGCIFYDCKYEPGIVDIQFYPEMEMENATHIMGNLSNKYNFTINGWDFQKYKRNRSDDTIIKSWIVVINVTVGQEKWISSELEKNASIYRARLRYADC